MTITFILIVDFENVIISDDELDKEIQCIRYENVFVLYYGKEPKYEGIYMECHPISNTK